MTAWRTFVNECDLDIHPCNYCILFGVYNYTYYCGCVTMLLYVCGTISLVPRPPPRFYLVAISPRLRDIIWAEAWERGYGSYYDLYTHCVVDFSARSCMYVGGWRVVWDCAGKHEHIWEGGCLWDYL